MDLTSASSNLSIQNSPNPNTRFHDTFLILSIGLVAACGLVYEYLMAHYTGRILGSVEPTLYTMIGLMIVAMGIGAFAAKWISDVFRGFAWLELSVALIGATAVLTLSGVVALAYSFPEWLRTIYGMDVSIPLEGGLATILLQLSRIVPFILGFVIGLLIGMEIPLIARVRERIHARHLEHNLGTMYGADYIGAGLGAAIWVLVCLQLPIVYAAVGTAAANTIVGFAFLIVYRKELQPAHVLWIGHLLMAAVLVVMATLGNGWISRLGDTLFKDRVIYQIQTPYQNVVLTKRHIAPEYPDILSLYINGRLQFASNDEAIYHAYLTAPAMLASNRTDRILLLGGGDGLALRDILRWNPQEVVLIDIDSQIIELFSGQDSDASSGLTRSLLQLNEEAFSDDRVRTIIGDAFIEIEELVAQQQFFDVVIADLPDPSHPDLNRLYSDYFYARIAQCLSPDGAFVAQSTSPFHAKNTFISIGKTMANAGFQVEQYRANVPSFGEWGWSIGTKTGRQASERIAEHSDKLTPDGWLGKKQILSSFSFPPHYHANIDTIAVNRLGSHVVYQYHVRAWSRNKGIFYAEKFP